MKYYIDLRQLFNNYQMYKNFGTIYFPVKTNPNSIILNALIDMGSCFEVDSIEHIKLVRQLFLSKGQTLEDNKILFSNVAKTFEEINFALENGITYFTIDDLASLEFLIKEAQQRNISNLKINFRMNISDALNSKNSYLGATVATIKKMIAYVNSFLNISYGLSFYAQPENEKNENPLEKVISYITSEFSDYNFEFIDIGGGNTIQSIFRNATLIKDSLANIGVKSIILEPGRDILSNVVELRAKIKKVTSYDDTTTIINLDAGVYNGLLDIKLNNRQFDMYLRTNTDHHLERVEEADIPVLGKRTVILRGPTSDSIDILGIFSIDTSIKLDEAEEVVIRNAGAYVEALESNFSGIKENKESIPLK